MMGGALKDRAIERGATDLLLEEAPLVYGGLTFVILIQKRTEFSRLWV